MKGKNSSLRIISTLASLFCASISYGKTLEYNLDIRPLQTKLASKEITALSINRGIPGPTIKAKIGDILKIEVNNHLDKETSIHWHGVLVPNRMDGVPYINTPPIKPGQSFTYEFPVKHSGTYWYHAHSGLQEQQGIYGSMIFYPEQETETYDEEHILVLSDWTDEDPEKVLANIKKDPDYYALKKDAVQSWYKVLSNGTEAIELRLNNSLNRMGPMDISDIGYDAFLVNGKKVSSLSKAKPGTKIKLRIINAAASSYFILEYAGGAMKVIESDGVSVEPFTTQKIRIAMAETYDVIVTVPDHKSYEFRASSEDGTGHASALLGHGELVSAPMLPRPNLVLMKHQGMGGMHDMSQIKAAKNSSAIPMDHSAHQNTQQSKQKLADKHAAHMAMSKTENKENMSHNMQDSIEEKPLPHVEFLDNYNPIKASKVTTLPKNQKTREIVLNLTGSMERYLWTINDTPMYAANKIMIKRGENIRFKLVNKTMMHHPIHLHGHFFRILNGQGDYSPLKHTVSVAPYETVEIEFDANETKDWIFHCHNLYHMKLGMGGVVSYIATKPDADVIAHSGNHNKDHGDAWFTATTVGGLSNLATIETKLMNNYGNLAFDARDNYKKDFEGELTYQRYLSQFLGMYLGGDYKREEDNKTFTGIIGFNYTLPLLIKTDLRLNTKGKFRLGFHNEHQLTDRLSLDWKWNTNKEYMFDLNYALNKQIYITGNYDSKERYGIGLRLKF